jgi:hypothetical protein
MDLIVCTIPTYEFWKEVDLCVLSHPVMATIFGFGSFYTSQLSCCAHDGEGVYQFMYELVMKWRRLGLERARRVLKYSSNSEAEGLGNINEGSTGFDRRTLGIVLVSRHESRE